MLRRTDTRRRTLVDITVRAVRPIVTPDRTANYRLDSPRVDAPPPRV